MMVKVYRASGQPVKVENIEMYHKEAARIYDAVLAKNNVSNTNVMDQAQSEYLTKLFTRIDKILLKKYPTTDEWPLMSEPSEMVKAVETYGPVAMAKNQETGELVYVILDVQF